MFVRGSSRQIGLRHGLVAAEEFRVVRFGGLEEFLGLYGERF
jgi:hypothetical protein